MIDNMVFFLAQSGLNKLGVVDWHLMAFICIGFATAGYFLLQYGVLRSRTSVMFGVVLLVAAGLIAAVSQQPNAERAILFAFCGLAFGGGVGFLVARQPVHAALGFATAVLSSAGVLFMQSALFVAAATIIVYAGATIIVFLFVLMFSQQQSLETYELKLNRPLLAALAGGLIFATLVQALTVFEDNTADVAKTSVTRPLSQQNTAAKAGMTAGLGRSMYTEYLLTVEIAGTLLLAATVGAIAVAQRTLESDE